MRRLVSLLALAGAACGIDAVGSLDPAADGDAGSSPTPPPVAPPDGTGDAGGSAPPPDCTADACALPEAPSPFSVVLFGDRAGACPSGFDALDLVEDPVPGAGSCACGNCTMTGTTCNTGTVGSRYSSDTDCDGTGGSVGANNGNCVNYNGSFISTYASVVPPAAVVGSCSAPGTGVPANVAVTARRACTRRPETCAEAACAPAGSMNACLMADGDHACPASAPTKHLVGSDLTLTCADCTCTTQATCGGTMTYYSGNGCTGSTRVLQANVCTQVNQASISSLKWAGVVATQTCTNVTPPATASAALDGVRTVCCP